MEKIFICPLPDFWYQIYEVLEHAWQASGRQGKPVPKPFILSSWHFTNDLEKMQRWDETIEWAEQTSFRHLIPEIMPDQAYTVFHVDDAPFVPPNRYWNYEPRPRPSREEVNAAAKKLQTHWSEIIGDDLAKITKPLRFTGRKFRRLVVLGDSGSQPPWGTWTSIQRWGARGSFADFRKAINKAIAPLEVDHIDFVVYCFGV